MGQELTGLLRTHNCGELRKSDIGKTVTLCGWVNKSRDLGALFFMDIRDKHGMTQLSFDTFKGDLSVAKKATLESVIMATGVVRMRPTAALNELLPTGEVEIETQEFKVLSPATEVPFLPYGQIESSEDLRLKYRYLDLRTIRLQQILGLRSKTILEVRKLLTDEGFVEVETPILYKSTPEGARDYIVPSRVHPGKVYALPQSPQTLKQLLMIGGTDKYFQICRCFRDEDLRADRQPEFTQIDIEVSFCTPLYIKNVVTKMLKRMFALDDSFTLPEMDYRAALADYGTDRPDLRFGLKHWNVTSLFAASSFATFQQVASADGLVKAIFVPASFGTLARKDIDELVEVVKPHGGQGVAWFKIQEGATSGGISKFIDEGILKQLSLLGEEWMKKASAEGSAWKTEATSGDGIWFFVADKDPKVAHAATDALRRHFMVKLKLVKGKDQRSFVWVHDFPLLEFDSKTKRFMACHHPFTAPHVEDLQKFFDLNIKGPDVFIRAQAYDIVCNGYELGGGSIRIHDPQVQQQMFHVLGMGPEEIQHQFGFFVEALKYGTPPHGGLAFGMDRLMMMLAKTDNIRDVIAFPKTTSATDLMSSCPSSPAEEQTKDLHFQWRTTP